MGSTGRRALNRRAAELKRRFGRQLAEQRLEFGVTQKQVAVCAGLDQAHISRIEAGLANPSLETLLAIGSCVGAELGLRLFPTAGPRLHDRFQAPVVEALIREAGPGWRSQPEVPVPSARGVLDLVLTRSLDHLTVACECHSELRRLEQVVRRLAEKTEGVRVERAATQVSSLLVVRSTTATRSVARTFEATLVAAYPARSADALAALRGATAWPGPAMIWARIEGGRVQLLERPPRGVRVGR